MEDELALLRELLVLRDECVAAARDFNWRLEGLAVDAKDSAINMIHCLWMRSAERKLVSLCSRLKSMLCLDVGSHETHNLAAILTVISVLERLTGQVSGSKPVAAISETRGKELLMLRKNKLYKAPPERFTAIMATLDPGIMSTVLLKQLLEADKFLIGRINTAHDSPEAWKSLIERLGQVEKELGAGPTPLHVDLAGPKLRTLPVVNLNAVRKFRPTRNERGAVVSPVQITIGDEGLAIDGSKIIRKSRVGDEIQFTDIRGKKLKGRVVDSSNSSLTFELKKTAYLEGGIKLKLSRKGITAKLEPMSRDEPIVLDPGSVFRLVPANVAGDEKKKRVPVDLGGAVLRIGDRGKGIRIATTKTHELQCCWTTEL